jgi:hypothetical protein
VAVIGVRYVQHTSQSGIQHVLSILHYQDWTGEMMQSFCTVADQEKHSTPHQDCTCGFYAYKNIASMDGMSVRKGFPNHLAVIVVGGYGRVVEHEKGFRSEYMQPLSVIWPIEIEEMVIALGNPEIRKSEFGFTAIYKSNLEHYRYVPAELDTARRTAGLLNIPIIDVDRAKEMLGE